MGIGSIYVCGACGDPFSEHGDWFQCNDDCQRAWCCIHCANKDGYRAGGAYTAQRSCAYCRNEEFEADYLLTYALKELEMSRRELKDNLIEDLAEGLKV